MRASVRQPLLLGVAVLALGVAAVIFLTHRGQASGVDGDIAQTALCSSCGHYEDTTFTRLAQLAPSPQFQPALAPAFGPGYPCPTCGKPTFYRNPIVCEKCGRKFPLSVDEQHQPLARCPECGWVRY